MRVVVTGASGQLGGYVLDRLQGSDHSTFGWSRAEAGRRGSTAIVPVDLADPAAIGMALDRDDPEAILHLGAVSRVDRALDDPLYAQRVNAEAPETIRACADRKGRRVIYTSTDLVFDGSRPWSTEDDPAAPILTYGRTKLDGEARILRGGGHLVVRLALLYGPSRSGRPTFLDSAFDDLRQGRSRAFFGDEYRTPIDYASAADALVRLLERPDVEGLLHVAGFERVSRHQMIRRLASAVGLDPKVVLRNRRADVPSPEPRPSDVSLVSKRLAGLLPDLIRPSLEEGFRRCLDAPQART